MSDIPVLKLSSINKDYRQGRSIITVLRDVNLEVKRGATIAIIGASGSGKSTLLHIAALLDSPDSGEVELVGLSSAELKSRILKIRLQNLGFVYQHHRLLKDFSAVENVMMPRLIAGEDADAARENASLMLANLGLGKRLYNLPGELSGGEQQRVAIARALINKPSIILADEPTGNLDPSTADEVFSLLLEYGKKYGAAIIMVTHNLELSTKMQHIYKLKDGHLESSHTGSNY